MSVTPEGILAVIGESEKNEIKELSKKMQNRGGGEKRGFEPQNSPSLKNAGGLKINKKH